MGRFTAECRYQFPELERDYEAAWAEWSEAGDGDVWGEVGGDGLSDAAR